MSAIVTITFNPAVDKSVSVQELIPEKKLKCSDPVYEPGGGGINVARAIVKIGGRATAIYPAGGETGEKITRLLIAEGVDPVAVAIKNSTRENLVVTETAYNRQYLFDMPGATVSSEEWRECLAEIDRIRDVEYIVASGSLPPGVPTDIFARIALIARKKNARLIIDTSGVALKQAAKIGVFMIKPNLRELGSLTGRDELSYDEVPDVAREIIEKGNCEAIVVSMASEGAVLVTRELAMHIIPPPAIMHSTVGAGDSMVAGMVLSLAKGKTLPDAVQYGVACGTAATMNTGTELCREADVQYLYSIIKREPMAAVCDYKLALQEA